MFYVKTSTTRSFETKEEMETYAKEQARRFGLNYKTDPKFVPINRDKSGEPGVCVAWDDDINYLREVREIVEPTPEEQEGEAIDRLTESGGVPPLGE